MSDIISARRAVEKVLARRIAEDPGFITRLTLDPDATVKPLIAQILSDDGEVDLSDVAITVHVETDDRVHLVVPAGAGADDGDVSGFALRTSAGSLLNRTAVRFDPAGSITRASGLETHSGICLCVTEDPAQCPSADLCDLTMTC